VISSEKLIQAIAKSIFLWNVDDNHEFLDNPASKQFDIDNGVEIFLAIYKVCGCHYIYYLPSNTFSAKVFKKTFVLYFASPPSRYYLVVRLR
jgi:hypothetical protein